MRLKNTPSVTAHNYRNISLRILFDIHGAVGLAGCECVVDSVYVLRQDYPAIQLEDIAVNICSLEFRRDKLIVHQVIPLVTEFVFDDFACCKVVSPREQALEMLRRRIAFGESLLKKLFPRGRMTTSIKLRRRVLRYTGSKEENRASSR